MNSILSSDKEIAQYETMLRPFAYNLTQNREDSEDLIQDTLYRALANRDKFSEGTNMKGWLFTIMRNTFINNYHKKQRTSNLSNNKTDLQLAEYKYKTASNGSERSFMIEAIDKAMKQVSEDFTGPFMMFFEGYQYNEIASKYNVPLGTIKSRIFAARKELKNKLRELDVINSVLLQ